MRPSHAVLLLPLVLVPDLIAQQRVPAGLPGDPPPAASWSTLDLEARWSAWLAADTEDPGVRARWIAVLGERADHELLEWIVLSEETGWLEAADALVAGGDPRWMRASVLALDSGDSHNREGTRRHLREHGGLFLGWLERFPEARQGAVEVLARQLEEQQVEPVPDPGLAGPLGDEELYGALREALVHEPRELAPGEPPRPDVLYTQTVERALRVAQARACPSPRVLGWLEDLARSGPGALAVRACLAFTHFPPEAVPQESLVLLSQRDDRPQPLRAAAWFAATYGPRPRALVMLHEPLLDPASPHLEAALSRLAELGNGFTLTLLDELSGARTLSETQRVEASRARGLIEGRGTAWSGSAARDAVRAAAWAVDAGSVVAPRLEEWTLRVLSGVPLEVLEPQLADLLGEPEEAGPAPTSLDLRERALARRLLEREESGAR